MSEEGRSLLPANHKTSDPTFSFYSSGLPVTNAPTANDMAPSSRQEIVGFSTPLQSPLQSQQATPPDTPTFVAADAEPLLQYIVLWKNPALSAVSLVGALLAVGICATAHTWWPHGSFITLLCKVLLIDLAFNFIRGMLSSTWQQKSLWVNSQLVVQLCNAATSLIKQLALLHDKFLSARDPVTTLQVALAIWGLSILSCFLSSFTLAVLGILCLFSIPWALAHAQPHVAKATKAVTAQAKEHYQRLGFTRKAELGLILCGVVAFVLTSHWNTIAMACFVALVALRCKLKQNEVDAIHVAAAPYTESVTKASKAISAAASDCVARLTPVRHRYEP